MLGMNTKGYFCNGILPLIFNEEFKSGSRKVFKKKSFKCEN
jgi:hypothetical protein